MSKNRHGRMRDCHVDQIGKEPLIWPSQLEGGWESLGAQFPNLDDVDPPTAANKISGP